MNTKLATITTQYSKFSDNQVLTKRQLNQFLEYFEDQDHLSRIGLSGVGIVCGFNVNYFPAIREIEITQGYGVTTDGDLLTLIEPKISGDTPNTGLQLLENTSERYTHFRAYTSDNVRYTPFFYNGDNQIDILEIFPGSPEVINDDTYTPLTALSPEELSDKVVFLYLENYPKEGDLCTALNCDSQGIEQVAKLRVLLIATADAQTLISYDDIFNAHDWYEIYNNLPDVSVRRDILNSRNTDTYRNLKQNYYRLIKENETLIDLKLGLDTILTRFEKPAISSAITDVFSFVITKIPEDFQYHYDLLKDLVDTYTEIKELLLHINVHCCPDIGAFPKHLMLGKLVESNPFPTLRHRFYKSPIIGDEDTNLQRVQSLISRVIALVSDYNPENKGNEIKITPSQAQGALGQKAIPFYYHLTDALINHWDFNKYINFVQKTNLSYHTTNLSPALAVQEPLYYSLDHTNFLTIEGIQGRPYRDALEQVLDLKESYGLNFDVKVLSMNATRQNIDLDDYRCQFEDLNVLLQAWTTEQECTLASVASFFSGFSTQEVGKNIKEVEYTQKVQILDVEIDEHISDRVTKTGPKILGNRTVKASDRVTNTARKSAENRTIKGSNPFLGRSYKKNVVDENITVDEETLGFHMKRAIDDNKKGSINDIKNAAKEYVEAFVTNDQWETEQGKIIRNLVIYDAIDLMAATYVLTERVPQNIAQIDLVTIDTYELTLEEVCALVKRLKVTYQRVELNDTLHQILGLLINQLSFVCCSGEKLAILLDEIEKRKQDILNQIQLSQFVKKHPGLRHRRGVPQGGTFVMAYLTEEAADEPTYETVTMELDFLDQPNIDDEGTDGDEGRIQLWDDRLSTRFAFLHRVTEGTQNPFNEIVMIGRTIEITVSNLADFLNNIWSVAGAQRYCTAIAQGKKLTIELKDQPIRRKENYILFFNPALTGHNRKRYFDENEVIINNITSNNTVVADFALPYLCCSDCAPVNFVIPKEPISLSLPVTEVCLDDNDDGITPIPFTVSPADGEIKAFVEGTEIADVITQGENGTNYLDVSALDAVHYGKPMTFTVDDEETSVEIVIYADVQLMVTAGTPSYNEDHTQATVAYTVSGTIIDGLRFNWNLGDGNTSTASPNSDGIFEHTYNLPVNNANIITPGLSVNNGPCPHSIDIDPIVFEDPIIGLDIDGSVFCLDPNREEILVIPYEEQPSGATITLINEIEGVHIDDGQIHIDSTTFEAYNTPILFAVNDEEQETPVITIINKDTFADFSCNPENITVNEGTDNVTIEFTIEGLTNAQKEELGFNWEFGDGNSSSEINASPDFDVAHQYTISNAEPGLLPFEVVLAIEGGPCGFVRIAKTVEITINEVDVIFNLDRHEVCLDRGTFVGYELTPVVPLQVQEGIEGITIGTSIIEIDSEVFNAFNTPIKFLVDGELNDNQVLTVWERPVDLSIIATPEASEVDEGTDTISVDFSINHLSEEQENSLTILWDFGNGNTSSETNPTHEFTIQDGITGPIDFPITVTIDGGPCITESITIDHEVTITVNEIDIFFRINDHNICLDRVLGTASADYELNPPVSLEVLDGIEGVTVGTSTIEIDAELFTAFNTPIRFLVNGELNNSQILTVWEKPVDLSIAAIPETSEVDEGTETISVDFSINHLSEEQENSLTILWDFGNGNTSSEINPTHEFTIQDGVTGPIDFPVTVTIDGGPCITESITIDHEVTITVNEIDVTFTLNDHEICVDGTSNIENVGYILTPAVSLEVENNVNGITIDSGVIKIDLRLFSAFDTPIRFIVNDQLDTTEVLFVRRQISVDDVNFGWNPTTPTASPNQVNISIAFNGPSINTAIFPNPNITWVFSDGQNTTGMSPNMVFNVEKFPITATAVVSNAGCEEVPRSHDISIVFVDDTVDTDPVPNPCFDDVIRVLSAINNSDALNVPQNTPKVLKDTIFIPTQSWYTDVINNSNDFLDGKRNGEVFEIFHPLLILTGNEIKNKETNLDLVSRFFRAQIILFYNILCCQQVDKLNAEENKNEIEAIQTTIKDCLASFLEGNINVDSAENQLLNFLTDYIRKKEGFPPFIIGSIENDILPLLTPVDPNDPNDPKDSDKARIDKIRSNISRDIESLNPDAAISGRLRKSLLFPTIRRYESIEKSASTFLNGEKNGRLSALFNNLLSNTHKAVIDNAKEKDTFETVSHLYTSQIKLFFNILCCQDEETLHRSRVSIGNIMERIQSGLSILKEKGIDFDTAQLKVYFKDYLGDKKISKNTKKFISRVLMPLVK